MAKKSAIEKNKRREKLVAQYAAKREALKKIISSQDASYEEKMDAAVKLQKLPRDGSYTRQRNRCAVTGRTRGVYRKFGLCRICLREMAHAGQLPGVTKSSW